METHARYLLVGISSLFVTLLLIVFALWLGKLEFNRAFTDYDVRFHESVSGLAIGATVQLNGIQVGQVRRLGLDPNNPAEVSVIVRLHADTPITIDTKAQLTYTGLTGVAAIELLGATANSPRLSAQSSASLPRIESIPSTFGRLMQDGGGVMERAQVLMQKATEVLSEQNIAHISQTLTDLAAVSTNIKNDYPEFSALLRRAQHLEAELTRASQRADQVLLQVSQELSRSADDPNNLRAQSANTLLEIQKAATALAEASHSAQHTLGQADQLLGTNANATLQSVQALSARLQQLIERFDQGPADYLLGRQALPAYYPTRDHRAIVAPTGNSKSMHSPTP